MGGGSFEERGEIEEDFASSQKLVVEIDQEFKDLLEQTRGVLLVKIDKLKEVLGGAGDWFDETGSLGVENQVKGAIRDLEKQILEIDENLMKISKSQHEREQKGNGEPKQESDDLPLMKTNRVSKPSWEMRKSSRKSSSATALKNGTSADSRESVCECRWRRVRSGWNLSSISIRVHGDVRGGV